MAAPDSAGADLERAESLIRQALATSPLNPSAHFAKGRLLRAQRRCEDSIPEYEAVLAFNRNAVPAVMGLAICKFLTGSEDEVISFTEHPPQPPRCVPLPLVHAARDRAFLSRAPRRGDPLARKGAPCQSPFPFPHAGLAAAYGLKGDLARAAAELAEATEGLKRRNDNRFATIALIRKNAELNTPPLHDRFEQYLITGLRKAGLPEE